MYTTEELKKILARTAGILGVEVDDESLTEMARRSRGTPRVANRMLKRIRDFSQVKGNGNIDLDITREGLEALGVDELGLEKLDRDIILTIIERFGGGPVGIDTIAASLGEEKVTLEDVNEPFLIQSGLLYRTQKGRMVSREGYRHFGLEYPELEEQMVIE
jgi:Holliday junction DNA helicase RuvB